MRTARLLAASGITAAFVLIAPTFASAASDPPAPEVWSTQLAAPFSLEIDGPRVLVADGGTGVLGQLQPDGAIAPIVTGVDGLSGVAVRGKWLAYTSTHTQMPEFINTASGLNIRTPKGVRIYADTHAWEVAHNPDEVNTYGPQSEDPCVLSVLGPRYEGLIDSHAYSVASWDGKWIVADAGANALFEIDDSGHISTLAVLPPQSAKITEEAVTELGMPECLIGTTYDFEPVPTDVEVGSDGMLYVTTLPGGPESAALGARGALWRVDPATGDAEWLAGGFLGATNLALGKDGQIYVSELFGGKITEVTGAHTTRTYAQLPGVVTVETAPNGTVWAATMGNEEPPAPGTIVSISNGKVTVQANVKH
ncbi:ScyD/ScyE family protein [Microbacterium bovistercoris]|uniref:ScyD/ScyE family protein n=1 Tax=Microbacterium bovistercoris TaxID=2293570 RepID=A0A371NW36_9MICO|nr:ScyD/ScyE family protein [Microbacterium bovistercoris]REJ06987.1 ScyD/ScyE family protein [Microbacterium bovistercoris]